jgi:DNA-binding transcriptional ArsR family regulator
VPATTKRTPVRHRADQQLIKVMAHPLRVQSLTLLTERVASPKEIAKTLGVGVTKLSYHIRELEKVGLIELVDEKKRRGAVEHFYRATIRPMLDNEESGELSFDERQALSSQIVQLTIGDVAKAFDAGTIDDRIDRHLTRIPVLVDEEGWQELVEINASAFQATLDVQAASAERMAQSKGESEGIHVSASIFCFEVPEGNQRLR